MAQPSWFRNLGIGIPIAFGVAVITGTCSYNLLTDNEFQQIAGNPTAATILAIVLIGIAAIAAGWAILSLIWSPDERNSKGK
jgi:hypothetical protein